MADVNFESVGRGLFEPKSPEVPTSPALIGRNLPLYSTGLDWFDELTGGGIPRQGYALWGGVKNHGLRAVLSKIAEALQERHGFHLIGSSRSLETIEGEAVMARRNDPKRLILLVVPSLFQLYFDRVEHSDETVRLEAINKALLDIRYRTGCLILVCEEFEREPELSLSGEFCAPSTNSMRHVGSIVRSASLLFSWYRPFLRHPTAGLEDLGVLRVERNRYCDRGFDYIAVKFEENGRVIQKISKSKLPKIEEIDGIAGN